MQKSFPVPCDAFFVDNFVNDLKKPTMTHPYATSAQNKRAACSTFTLTAHDLSNGTRIQNANAVTYFQPEFRPFPRGSAESISS